MKERLKEIKRELETFNEDFISRFDGSREEFIIYFIYVFTGLMQARFFKKEKQDFFNDLMNGIHALDVLLVWSRGIDKRSGDFKQIREYVPPTKLRYMLDAYDKAEDYSIVTEAFSSHFTNLNIEDKTVTITSRNETDYLRELVSHTLGLQKSDSGFMPFWEEWSRLAREGVAEQEPQLERLRLNPHLIANHLENLRANQLHVGGKRFKRLYDYFLRKNRSRCELDTSCDLGGFTILDYVKALSAVESLATENFIKCNSLYSDPVLSKYLHIDIGRLLGVEGSSVRIDFFSYWSIIVDKAALVSRIAKLAGLTAEVSQAVVRFMTFDPERDGGHIIESPFIELCDKLIFPPFLVPNFNLMDVLPNKLCDYAPDLYSRLMRTVSREKIERLTVMLREAGFEVGTEIFLKENGKLITDIDIIVHDPRENTVLLIEHKSNLVPHTDKVHYIDKNLRRAEKQLICAMEYIDSHREQFCSDCRIDTSARFEICILMANNLGSSNSGVTTPIITTEKMYELISGSRGSLGRILKGLENERYMKEIDTSAYYVEKETYSYAGYTFVFDALKFT